MTNLLLPIQLALPFDKGILLNNSVLGKATITRDSKGKFSVMKGHIPWNKGLTKETSSSVAKYSCPRVGYVAWNKGQTKYTNPIIAKYAEEKCKGRISSRKGLTKETDESVARQAAKARWYKGENRTIAQIEGAKRGGEKHRGRPKNILAVIKTQVALLGRTKETYSYLEEVGKKRMGKTKFHDEGRAIAAKKVSEALTGRTKATHPYIAEAAKKFSGPLNHNWNGGSSIDHYGSGFTPVFRKRIKVRDNYTCQMCGLKHGENSKKLAIHHIDYNKKNHSEDNLFTLCMECNTKANYDRSLWQNYFELKMRFRNDCIDVGHIDGLKEVLID